MTATVDTELPGSPASIRAVGAWLQDTLRGAASDLDDDVHVQYRRVPEVWQGDGAEGLRSRLATLTSGGEGVATAAQGTGRELEALASALELSQADMATARSTATAGGLRVVGTTVHGPGAAPPDVPALASDATPDEAAARQRGIAAIERYDAQCVVWEEVVALVEGAALRWTEALDAAVRTWEQNRGNLTGMFAEFMSAGVTATARAAVAFNASQLRRFHLDAADDYAAHVRAVQTPDGRVTTSRGHFYDLLDTGAQHVDDAAAAAKNIRAPQVAAGLGRGLMVLGVGATAYGIYDDMQNGESGWQAAASNGAGFAASIGAGMAIGAAVGSVVPVGGTIVGGIVGAVGGTVVGLVTSGMVDSMWENGVSSIGDVGDALLDGVDEMAQTFSDAGSMVADAAGAVGGGLKDAWDAIF